MFSANFAAFVVVLPLSKIHDHWETMYDLNKFMSQFVGAGDYVCDFKYDIGTCG